MSEIVDKVDSLKSFDEILVVDPRNEGYAIEDWHKELTEISLNPKTPIKVQQIFENAKNIALYTYYSYRLHQSAETIAYSALEVALQLKFEAEKNSLTYKRKPIRLEQYMNIALEQKWITDEGYESSRAIAAHRVRRRYVYDIINNHSFDNGEGVPIPEPTEEEIIDEMRTMGLAETRLHAGRHIRNHLAHGNSGLAPSSFGTLRIIAEEINQLFCTDSSCVS